LVAILTQTVRAGKEFAHFLWFCQMQRLQDLLHRIRWDAEFERRLVTV
jgi:hypothetical protein